MANPQHKTDRQSRLHSIGDVADDGRAQVAEPELRALLDMLIGVARDAENARLRAFATRICMAAGGIGWRPSVRDLVLMRRVCLRHKSRAKAF